jgi:hypothetical protein
VDDIFGLNSYQKIYFCILYYIYPADGFD